MKNQKQELSKSIQQICQCPISHEPMIQAVITADGHTYQRKQIQKWLEKSQISPNTNLRLKSKQLIPNIIFKVLKQKTQGIIKLERELKYRKEEVKQFEEKCKQNKKIQQKLKKQIKQIDQQIVLQRQQHKKSKQIQQELQNKIQQMHQELVQEKSKNSKSKEIQQELMNQIIKSHQKLRDQKQKNKAFSIRLCFVIAVLFFFLTISLIILKFEKNQKLEKIQRMNEDKSRLQISEKQLLKVQDYVVKMGKHQREIQILQENKVQNIIKLQDEKVRTLEKSSASSLIQQIEVKGNDNQLKKIRKLQNGYKKDESSVFRPRKIENNTSKMQSLIQENQVQTTLNNQLTTDGRSLNAQNYKLKIPINMLKASIYKFKIPTFKNSMTQKLQNKAQNNINQFSIQQLIRAFQDRLKQQQQQIQLQNQCQQYESINATLLVINLLLFNCLILIMVSHGQPQQKKFTLIVLLYALLASSIFIYLGINYFRGLLFCSLKQTHYYQIALFIHLVLQLLSSIIRLVCFIFKPNRMPNYIRIFFAIYFSYGLILIIASYWLIQECFLYSILEIIGIWLIFTVWWRYFLDQYQLLDQNILFQLQLEKLTNKSQYVQCDFIKYQVQELNEQIIVCYFFLYIMLW